MFKRTIVVTAQQVQASKLQFWLQSRDAIAYNIHEALPDETGYQVERLFTRPGFYRLVVNGGLDPRSDYRINFFFSYTYNECFLESLRYKRHRNRK